jgi:hypothetical protein
MRLHPNRFRWGEVLCPCGAVRFDSASLTMPSIRAAVVKTVGRQEMINKTVHGQDALGYIVGLHSHSFVTVREFHCGIDIDNCSRYYEHDYASNMDSLNWTVLNYLSGTKAELSQYFSAAIDDDDRVREFYIHTDLDDIESRGIRYEFTY